ncbi:MAG TPA: NUDIX domain-containing protein [Ilumatobacteraceae bacterium]|nr:NUDIX domain-containing protein [Ilumatobacteraceae bacterium]
MARLSAGIVLYRTTAGPVEVLLGHMGGPYWARRDVGAWTIPKGEYEAGEDPFAAACREFEEEIGRRVPATSFVDLGEVRQSGGKVVRAWAAEGDLDPATAVSNTFEMEWPLRSGTMQTFPELDRVAWFDVPSAVVKIVSGQRELVERLVTMLSTSVQI